MLAVVNTSCPPRLNAGASSLWSRPATASASSASLRSSSRTVNSSPPRRDTVSPGRMAALQPARDLDEQLVAGRVAESCR